MKKTKKAIAALAIAGMALSIPFNALAEGVAPERLGGFTAAQTAVQIAEQTGWTGTAILSSSTPYGMVDALTAGPLASLIKAPILLQEAGNILNPDTKAELLKLKVNTIYVTSGTAVISQSVLDELKGMGMKVVSLGGKDRFETSVNIAKQMVALGANVNKVAVAFGWLNQDALSIAAIASAQTEPILLTEKEAIPASVMEFLRANAAISATDVIGGPGVISDAVKAQLPNPTRHFGYTAYDTNLAVLKAFDNVLKYDRLFVANGETGIDALAGAPLAALYKAGIVLTKGTANEGTIYAGSKLSATSKVTALGGTAVVPDVVLNSVIPSNPEVPEEPEEPANPGGGGGSGGGGGGGGGGADTTAPVITRLGSATVNLANGAAYTDAGATVTDNRDNGLNVTVSYTKDGNPVPKVDTFTAGTYIVHYNVSDAAGNPANPVTRTVIVGDPVIVSVATKEALNAALLNQNVTHINFTANISQGVTTVRRSVTIDFGTRVLTGNLAFTHTLTGTSRLYGTAPNSIVGTLSVDTENASFVNDVHVSGGVNLINVEPGTWTESADGNVITITDDDGATITIEGNPGAITVTANADGGLTISVNPGATVGNITSNAPMTLQVSAGATMGTVTANAPIAMTVASGATVDDITIGSGAAGSTILNNGTATNMTVEEGANGTTITNNGTATNVTTNANINLIANVAPTHTTVGETAVVTTTGTQAGSVHVDSLENFIDAVNAGDVGTIIGALQALADISPLSGSIINPANAAAYNDALDVAPVPTTVTQIRARVDAVNAARSALQAAISDAEAKVQADYTAASWTALQTALGTANNVNTNPAATAPLFTNAANALTEAIDSLILLPKITDTSINNAILTNDTLTLDFADLGKNSGIMVSKDTRMSLSIGTSGTIGDFNLKAGQTNSLLSVPLPSNQDLNLTQSNMTAIFNAIKALAPAEKQAILNTVDFAKVLELVQATDLQTQNLIFGQIGFADFYSAISHASPELKLSILANMTKVIDVSLSENSDEFKEAVEDIMKDVVLKIPQLTDDQTLMLVKFYLSQDTDVTALLNNLQLTLAQKESLLSNMKYTALFDAMMDHLEASTRADMFKEVNFTDLFTALKSADVQDKAKITENMVSVMDLIEDSNIPRAEMLDALVFGANKRAAIYQVLKNLDGTTNNYVTLTLTLTDDDGLTKTYTMIINE